MSIQDQIDAENARIKRSGGPAYPVLYGQTNGADGLTKREYMATAAMAAIIGKAPIVLLRDDEQTNQARIIAVGAVAYADAMLAELAK